MKLLTEGIKNRLHDTPLYSQEKVDNPPIIVKFFAPWSNWTWYVLEAELQEGGDWLFYGLVDGFEKELGYFTFNELQLIRGPFGLTIERDLYFSGKHLNDVR